MLLPKLLRLPLAHVAFQSIVAVEVVSVGSLLIVLAVAENAEYQYPVQDKEAVVKANVVFLSVALAAEDLVVPP